MPKKTQMDSILPISDAIKMHRKQYNAGDTDYSVTTLMNPPRIVHLDKRHLAATELYVFDQLSSMIGTAMHEYIEKLLGLVDWRSYICEERLRDVVLDRKISGAYDMLHQFDLYDLKTTSTWKIIHGTKNDWTAQQNMYRLLFKKERGIVIEKLYVIGMFLDWTLYKMMQSGKEYPRDKVVQYSLDVWEYKDTQEYMERRCQLMIDNENVADDDLPPCSHDEMWADNDTWAVKRKDRKRALRVLDTEQKAVDWMNNYVHHNTDKVKIGNLFIEPRLGRRKRCMDWCSINVHCNHFHEYMKRINLNYDKTKR